MFSSTVSVVHMLRVINGFTLSVDRAALFDDCSFVSTVEWSLCVIGRWKHKRAVVRQRSAIHR